MSKPLRKKASKPLLAVGRLLTLEEGAGRKRFPRVSKFVPPGTHYKIERINGATYIALMTIMPDGSKVAWDSCGRCHNHVRLCGCHSGVVANRSIEYIFDMTAAKLAGEEWSIHHRNYKGTILATRDEGRKNRVPSMPNLGTQHGQKRPWEEIDAKPNKPLKPMAKEATDAGALLKATNQMADDLEKQFTKKLSKPKKTLTKRK